MDIKTGTKIDPSQVGKLDASKKGKGKEHPTEAEVEGQAVYEEACYCPCGGHLNYVWADSNYYQWFECWACDCLFEA